jgi:hypothetical protein
MLFIQIANRKKDGYKMANKRIRKKQAKLSGASQKFHPQNLFRSEISIKSTEVSPYSESKLIQTAQQQLAQMSYFFWFKEPIELEDVTRDDLKYLASGKVLKEFQDKIEPIMRVDKVYKDQQRIKNRASIQLANYFNTRNPKSVRQLTKAVRDLERQAKRIEKQYRKSPILRRMLNKGETPDFWTVVRYGEIEIR